MEQQTSDSLPALAQLVTSNRPPCFQQAGSRSGAGRACNTSGSTPRIAVRSDRSSYPYLRL